MTRFPPDQDLLDWVHACFSGPHLSLLLLAALTLGSSGLTGCSTAVQQGVSSATSAAGEQVGQALGAEVVRAADPDRVQVRVHSPRTEVSVPEDGPEDLGQYRTVDALRDALMDAEIDGRTTVFEDTKDHRILTDSDVTADHAWIGRPRFETITFFAREDAAVEYVRGLDASSPSS